MFLTQHAVERFRERWAAGLSYQHALRELRLLSRSARRLRERTAAGDLQFEASDGSGIIFVVKREPGFGDGLVCATVLPEPEAADPAVPEEPA